MCSSLEKVKLMRHIHSTTQHAVPSRTKAKSGQFTDTHCGQTISGNFSSLLARFRALYILYIQAHICLASVCLCVCVCVQSCRHTLTPFVCIFFGSFVPRDRSHALCVAYYYFCNLHKKKEEAEEEETQIKQQQVE